MAADAFIWRQTSQARAFAQHTRVGPDDLDKTPNTDAPHLRGPVVARLNRRHWLQGGVGAMAMSSCDTLGYTAADEVRAIAGNA